MVGVSFRCYLSNISYGANQVHPTWQRTRPNDENDTHCGWTFTKPDEVRLVDFLCAWMKLKIGSLGTYPSIRYVLNLKVFKSYKQLLVALGKTKFNIKATIEMSPELTGIFNFANSSVLIPHT